MAAPPPLVVYATENDYREHFERVYCHGPIVTFDGIAVRFRKQMFDHCFFETVNAKDDTFSRTRAERVDWIAASLRDSDADLFVGWDNKKKRPATNRRVTIVSGNYVTIIQMKGSGSAIFITAFLATGTTIDKIRRNPRWK